MTEPAACRVVRDDGVNFEQVWTDMRPRPLRDRPAAG